MIKTQRLLIEESPLTFQPTLAKTIGLNGAIFLQQLHFWIKLAEQRQDPKSRRDGRWWICSSYPEWVHQNFPFWSLRTLERIVFYLETELHVVIGRADPEMDGRKWYTIDYDQLDQLDVLPPEANAEDAALAPEPVRSPLSDSAACSSIPKACAPHVRRHKGYSHRLLPRQNDEATPRQVDEPPLVKLTSPPSSNWRDPPRQIDEGLCVKIGSHLKGIKDQRDLKETGNGGPAPASRPASPLLIPHTAQSNPRAVGTNLRALGTNPRAQRTGLIVADLPPAPATDNSMSNLFAAEPEKWRERISAWRASKKQEDS